jgi:hypothetical protein
VVRIRETGDSLSPLSLKTYQEMLAQYHLHPEGKFHNGDYWDHSVTHRRHISATAVELIGNSRGGSVCVDLCLLCDFCI